MLETEILDGEWLIYPGHPVVIAYLIVHRYPNLFSAMKCPEGSQTPAALGDSNIPGAGGNVWWGLDLLVAIDGNGYDFDLAVKIANEKWAHCASQQKSEALNARYMKGQDQAYRFTERLRTKLESWLSCPCGDNC